MQQANKYILILTKYSYLVVFTLFLFSAFSANANTPEVYRIKKVVIDPGHGGRDPGALGRKSKEKDITLAVALKLGEYINTNLPDVEVIYTRKEDVFVGLDERSRIANENGADLFISIHCNANPSRSPFGAETYVMGLHKSDGNLDVAMRENAVITYEEDYTTKYEGYDPNSAESFIIFSLMQHSFLEQSLNMASLVQDEFRERTRRHDRGVKQAGFLVLWRTSMPSVLVELGFLSNAKEEEYLMSSEGQSYLASAIFRAFRDYKQRVESRSTFTAESKFNTSISEKSDPKAPTISAQWAPDPTHSKATFTNGVQYKVQIKASRNPIPPNSADFKNVDNVEEFATDGLFKYLVGSKSTYNEALELSKQIRELFPDAFIIAFQDGKPISLDQARRLTIN